MNGKDRAGPQGAAEGERAPREAEPHEEIPLGQRLFDRPFLLLIVGILVTLLFYTGWGLWEVASLSEAPLP
jgi:hypothetical protein